MMDEKTPLTWLYRRLKDECALGQALFDEMERAEENGEGLEDGIDIDSLEGWIIDHNPYYACSPMYKGWAVDLCNEYRSIIGAQEKNKVCTISFEETDTSTLLYVNKNDNCLYVVLGIGMDGKSMIIYDAITGRFVKDAKRLINSLVPVAQT